MFFVEPALDKCLSTTVGWAMYDYLSQFIVSPSKNIINGYGHMMDMRIEDNPDHLDKLQLLHMGIYWYRWNKNPKDLLLSNPVICTRTTSYKRYLDLLLCTQDMSLYMHLRELHNLKKIYELIKKKISLLLWRCWSYESFGGQTFLFFEKRQPELIGGDA